MKYKKDFRRERSEGYLVHLALSIEAVGIQRAEFPIYCLQLSRFKALYISVTAREVEHILPQRCRSGKP